MTKEEFDNKKKVLKPWNDAINIIVFVDMLAWVASLIWLIWGGGTPAWRTFFTTIVIFWVGILFYYATCYEYFKEGAEKEKVDELRPTDPYIEHMNRNSNSGINFN